MFMAILPDNRALDASPAGSVGDNRDCGVTVNVRFTLNEGH